MLSTAIPVLKAHLGVRDMIRLLVLRQKVSTAEIIQEK